MSLHGDLLRQARHLATKEPRRPLQASLRRAVSAAYYSLFHLLVDEAVNRMISAPRDSPKLSPGLDGQLLQPELLSVAATFVDVQQARHEADYDTARRFTRVEVLDLIDRVEQATKDWHDVRRTAPADTFLVGSLAFGNMRN